jgi:CheY-like chemotaxis protein
LAELPQGSESTLLVEDEDAVRDLIREILQHSGYTVLGARHGGEALVVADRHPGTIHLLGTDVVMPGSGWPSARGPTRRCPTGDQGNFSGYTDEAIERRDALRPAAVFLRKPLTPQALRKTVREMLTVPR